MRLLLIITLLFSILNAQKREALLIGNSRYQYISNLKDTSYNLRRLKRTLEDLDFTVEVKTNLEAKKLKQAIDNFKERLSKSHDTIGFLYYSGHGCQMDNVGYLIPTNVNSSKSLDVKYDALNIDKMLETLREAGNRVNMVFLDACRDNTPTGKKGGKKGLAQAPVMPKGTLVVYATEATKTADDNSNFINSLIAQIKQPNRSIRDIGYNISDDVASQTGEQQVPQVFAQRVPNVFLKSGGSCTKVVNVPAIYKSVHEKVRVSDWKVKKVAVPPKYTIINKKIKVADGYIIYTWMENGIEKKLEPKIKIVTKRVLVRDGTERYVISGEEARKVSIPPMYKTTKVHKVEKDVDISEIPSYANYKSSIVPAKYRLVKFKKLIKSASLKEIKIPPIYKTITKRVLVTEATQKTISVPCSEIK